MALAASATPAAARSRHHQHHHHHHHRHHVSHAFPQGETRAMAYAPAESAGAGQGAWGAIERATQSGWHSASFETREPASSTSAASSATGLRGMVARHAAANGVPFALADAVVRIESGYNPRARNASGAMGLMQIKTQTARGQGFAGSANGLLDAETNIRFGMRYLATAYRMAGGDVCGTVMRYQSGHGARRMSGADRSYCSKARSLMARL